jgi:hypothetical protein
MPLFSDKPEPMSAGPRPPLKTLDSSARHAGLLCLSGLATAGRPGSESRRFRVKLVKVINFGPLSGRVGNGSGGGRLNPAPKAPKGRPTSGRVRAGAIALPGFEFQGKEDFS